jgi:hypothetical protein
MHVDGLYIVNHSSWLWDMNTIGNLSYVYNIHPSCACVLVDSSPKSSGIWFGSYQLE